MPNANNYKTCHNIRAKLIAVTLSLIYSFLLRICSTWPGLMGSTTLLVIQSNKSNKMLQTIWHEFSVQFSLLFLMVYSVLLSVLHFKTILLVDPDWLLKLFHQSAVGVLEGNTASKMEHTIWKSNETGAYTWCQIVCSILFDLFKCMTSSMTKWPISKAASWLNLL